MTDAPPQTTHPDPQGPIEEARALILAAFEQARARGKPDWYRMTVAVLKNRILQMADRGFDPNQYGASSMSDLVRRMADIVELDETANPPMVHLILSERPQEEGSSAQTGIKDRRARVRHDLFTAVLDFSSDRAYVWDLTLKAAVPATQGDGPALPTVRPEDLQEWRRTFAERISHEPDSSTISVWAERSLPTHFLPKHLQGEWNAELKRHVLERLEEWFAATGLDAPADLVSRRTEERPTPSVDQVEKLRAFVVAVVGSMTPGELRSLALPAGAVVRSREVL